MLFLQCISGLLIHNQPDQTRYSFKAEKNSNLKEEKKQEASYVQERHALLDDVMCQVKPFYKIDRVESKFGRKK